LRRRAHTIALISWAVASAGCAATAAVVPRAGAQGEPASAAANGPSRSTGGGRTQTVGLPLPPAAKIGLWTGVAVLLALTMADDDEDTGEASTAEP
jgi:hypothetical protein